MDHSHNNKQKIRIAVLVSGGGTNLQALIDAENNGIIKSGKLTLVLSNKSDAYALIRAEHNGLPAYTISKKEHPNQELFENAMISKLDEYGIDLIVLAGFMSILSGDFTAKYRNRIINVHPSLIPSFCGKGYYGLKVHEAAIERGVKITGATVHYVNEIPDGGEIIMQKTVALRKNETPESLQSRVMRQAEWKILPLATEEVCKILMAERNKK